MHAQGTWWNLWVPFAPITAADWAISGLLPLGSGFFCKWLRWLGEQPSHGSVASEYFTKANRSLQQERGTKARVLTMDNMRIDCRYLALSLPHDSQCLTLDEWISSVSHIAISVSATTVSFKIFSFFLHISCACMTSMLMGESLLYLLVTNVITAPCTAGKAKVLKRLNDELKDLQVFCISLLLYGFKKRGERGHLIMHIIWGYIQSLGFKLLDERLPWINVIFPLAYGHLLRAREKVFACAFTVNNLYYGSFRFIVPLNPRRTARQSHFLYLYICSINKTVTIWM